MAKTKTLASVTDGIRAADDECKSILGKIGRLKSERYRITRAPQSVDERITSFNQEIDAAAARYWEEEPNDVLIARGMTAGNILSFRDNIVPFQAAFFGDQLKDVYAQRLRTCATGEELSAAEKTARVVECDAQIHSLWQEFEDIACLIEAAGMTIERPGDLPPDIYLAWNGQTYSEEKLLKLEQRSESFSSLGYKYSMDRQNIQKEIADREYEIYSIQRNGELPWYGNVRPRIEGQPGQATEIPTAYSMQQRAEARLAESKKKLQVLAERYRNETSTHTETAKLMSACKLFLESKGIDIRSSDRLLRQSA